MFEVGYSEILVIAIVLIVVVGPKDLPKMLRAFGKAMTRFRQVSGDFRRQFDDALKEAELDEVRKTIDDVRKLDPRQQVRDVLNPLRSAAESIRNDVQNAVKPAMQSNPNGAPKVETPAVAPLTQTKSTAKTPKAKASMAKIDASVKPASKPGTKPVSKLGTKAAAKTSAISTTAAPVKTVAKPNLTKPVAAMPKAKPAAKVAVVSSAAAKPIAAKPDKPSNHAAKKAKS